MAIQKALVASRTHAVLMFQVGQELGGKRGSPRAVVHRVCKFVCALWNRLIQHDPNHGRHFVLFHLPPERHALDKRVIQVSTEAVREVHGGIALLRLSCVVGRKNDPGSNCYWMSPEPAEQGTDKLLLS